MKSLAVLLGLALLLVAVNARHYSDRIENEKRLDDDLKENLESDKDHRSGPQRHRRKRWQMNYGYDYPPPSFPYYYERREYDRNQEVMPQIWKLLDEISTYVRRPVQQQPIYIPYPVPYPVPQNCTCNVQIVPNVTSRFPELDDVNQNWGIAENTNAQDYEDDGTDGDRPISLEPIKPKTPMNRPMPEVEHSNPGAPQASNQATNVQEERVRPTPATGTCTASILTCCSERHKQQQKACFTRNGCAMTFTRTGCSKKSIDDAIESFRIAYSPM